ncbi:MAG TPA: hypothetical protein VJZ27_03965 [Aggregatilineales bacterium]|nr:hypothetical protein [Aggregatilineales bacterium]
MIEFVFGILCLGIGILAILAPVDRRYCPYEMLKQEYGDKWQAVDRQNTHLRQMFGVFSLIIALMIML